MNWIDRISALVELTLWDLSADRKSVRKYLRSVSSVGAVRKMGVDRQWWEAYSPGSAGEAANDCARQGQAGGEGQRCGPLRRRDCSRKGPEFMMFLPFITETSF